MTKRFLIFGCLGWCIEILWTGFHSLLLGDGALTAKTYLWMFPIYGAVAASWVSVNTVFKMINAETGEAFLDLNAQINSVLPKGLTAAFVLFCWYMIAKKKMSPIKVMLLLVVIAFVGVLIGFFDPQLAY